jgi:hypothetical protein
MMATARAEKPGLTGVLAVWVMWIVVSAATWATNARVPVSQLYGFHGEGIVSAAGRVVVLLGWPVALAAIPLLIVAVDRFLACSPTQTGRRVIVTLSVLSVCLCLTIAWPGAQQGSHLDARYINVPAGIGVAIAFGVTIYVLAVTGRGASPPRRKFDRPLLVLLAVVLFASLPWLFANLGFYVGDVPGLRSLFMSKQIVPEPGNPHLRAVHLGNHEGIDGVLLAVTAVVLMRTLGQIVNRARRTALSAYLSLLLVYGLAVALADGWHEQIVKRGWVATKVPNVLHPAASAAWLGVLLAALAVWLTHRRLSGQRTVLTSGGKSTGHIQGFQ